MAPPKGTCAECGEVVTAVERAAYKVEGIEVERDAGGQNHVRERTRVPNVLWHARYKGDCLDKHINGGQESML